MLVSVFFTIFYDGKLGHFRRWFLSIFLEAQHISKVVEPPSSIETDTLDRRLALALDVQGIQMASLLGVCSRVVSFRAQTSPVEANQTDVDAQWTVLLRKMCKTPHRTRVRRWKEPDCQNIECTLRGELPERFSGVGDAISPQVARSWRSSLVLRFDKKESQPLRSDACPSACHVPHKFVEDTSDWSFVLSRFPPKQLQAMAVENSLPNGSAQAPIEVSSLPTVIGINFGNSYASIAVITNVCASTFFQSSDVVSTDLTIQEGQAECIANEDGERQIACVISFHGEEMVSPCLLQFSL